MNLYHPVVPPDQWHSNFQNTWIQRNPWNECVIADWVSGFEDRDGKFAKEFQTTFNSSFWELYLFACLKQLNFTVDFSHQSPDFVISKGSEKFCVEAAIASNAKGTEAEWEGSPESRMSESVDRQGIVERSIPRLTNTLAAKHKRYRDYYSTLNHVSGHPFIVAIAPFEQPQSYMQTDRAIRNVLYQYDIPVYKDIPEENRRLIFGECPVDRRK